MTADRFIEWCTCKLLENILGITAVIMKLKEVYWSEHLYWTNASDILIFRTQISE
jgi:hypothetical protein